MSYTVMSQSVGIHSVAISFPSTIRTNDYWRESFPDLFTQKSGLAKGFSVPEKNVTDEESDIYTQELLPYLKDPFRGFVERRVLSDGESSLTLEYDAAKKALSAASLTAADIDLVIVSSLFPQHPDLGNAAFLAQKLEIESAAWNLESTCNSSVVAIQNACSLVRTGEYRKVLIVLSTTFSRYADNSRDTFSFMMGDGAGALVIGEVPSGQGLISSSIINTASTCGAFFTELGMDEFGNPRTFMRVGEKASSLMQDSFVKSCRKCGFDAMEKAGVTPKEIDFLITTTNTPWFSKIYARALGIDPERTLNLNSQYGNTGSVSPIAVMHHAIKAGKIRENDLVLICCYGAVSTAGAAVLRWSDIALG